jgi:hypothetical protein
MDGAFGFTDAILSEASAAALKGRFGRDNSQAHRIEIVIPIAKITIWPNENHSAFEKTVSGVGQPAEVAQFRRGRSFTAYDPISVDYILRQIGQRAGEMLGFCRSVKTGAEKEQ